MRRDAIQHIFQQIGRLIPGEPNLRVDHFSYVGAGDRQHSTNAMQIEPTRQGSDEEIILPDQRFAADPGIVSMVTAGITTSADPQVRPPPSASSSTRSPARMRPSCRASASASGTEAAEVLAWRSTVTTTRSGGSPSLRPIASMIRLLAWCGTSQSTSAWVRPLAASASSTASASRVTAWRNTSRPFITRWPGLSGWPTAPSTYRMSPSVPWAWIWVDSTPRRSSSSVVARAQEHRAGAVAEQHAGAAVLPVQDARIDLAADHQDAARLAGPDHAVGDRQAVDEPGAGRRQVEAEAPRDAQCRLHAQRGGGKRLVRRAGRQDDRVHVRGASPRHRPARPAPPRCP